MYYQNLDPEVQKNSIYMYVRAFEWFQIDSFSFHSVLSQRWSVFCVPYNFVVYSDELEMSYEHTEAGNLFGNRPKVNYGFGLLHLQFFLSLSSLLL